jgi:hypothetical protein
MLNSMHEMDENELQALIGRLSNTVERLAHERQNSPVYRHEAGILKDARQLLTEKRQLKTIPSEVTF